jgi:hypothetical protein
MILIIPVCKPNSLAKGTKRPAPQVFEYFCLPQVSSSDSWCFGRAELASDGWIWKTQDGMERETGLTRHYQREARKGLKAKGLLDERSKASRACCTMEST